MVESIEKQVDKVDKQVVKIVYKDATKKRVKTVYKLIIYGAGVGLIAYIYKEFKIKALHDKFDEIIRTVEKDLVNKYNHLVNNNN